MNIERTMEFILESQARHAARMDVIDKRMDGITKILRQGMRLVVTLQESHKETNATLRETNAKLKELAEAQKVTEKKLQRFIDSQGRRNGH